MERLVFRSAYAAYTFLQNLVTGEDRPDSGGRSNGSDDMIPVTGSVRSRVRGGSRNLERVVLFRAKYLGNALIYLAPPIYN